MRYVPVEYAPGAKVTVNGQAGEVKRHRVDDQVEVKLRDGRVVVVEARDIKVKG